MLVNEPVHEFVGGTAVLERPEVVERARVDRALLARGWRGIGLRELDPTR
jgi:hypothetical protein